MAIADNKVVTFKDLYGENSMASFSDVTPIQIEHPFFRGRVTPLTPLTPSGASLEKYYSKDQYNKRLKYLYYGYAFYGNSSSIENIFTGNNDLIEKPGYVELYSIVIFGIMLPIYHSNNCTSYKIVDKSNYPSDLRDLMFNDMSGNLIVYSSIQSLADEDMVNDIWMEYKPIVKTDPSTGEPMKDENGNLLYETNEEGNVLYEEGDYYAETRRADEGILPI